MANSKAGERIGGAGRQRVEIEEEILERKEQENKERKTSGASQSNSQPVGHGIRRKDIQEYIRYTEVRKIKA